MSLFTKLGFLVVVISVGTFLLVSGGVNLINHDPSYYNENLWPRLLTSVVIGMSLWYLGKSLNEDIADSKKKPKLSDFHTFLMIKMEYWGPIICILSIIMYFK